MSDTPILIILAGGASSRMWPLREKSLLRFGQEPLLLAQLHRYRALGFERVVIVGNNENHEQIRALVEPVPNLSATVVIQPEPRGMGDALLCAEPAVSALQPGAPIYVNQIHDVVEDTLHTGLLDAFRANPTRSYLAGVRMAEYFPGGYLIVDDDGRIRGMIEKPGPENRPSDFVNIVAHIHSDSARLFDAIRAEYAASATPDDHYERAMDRLMKDHVYQVMPYSGRWSALKFPWHTLDVMQHFLDQIDRQHIGDKVYIHPSAAIIGNVYIGDGAKVFPGASIVGPAYVGRGTIVGNNSLVRNSMVLDHCEVGFTTEIARSYVADRCSMHACRVLDSVFAPGVNFSAGCTTANLRIDHGPVPTMVKGQRVVTGRDKLGAIIGANAFIAVDVMTMPGVKIGEGARIGPGTHVHKDVNDFQRVYVKQEIIVEDA